MVSRFAPVALIAFLLLPPTAHAWGARGHRVATRVALSRLSPKAAAGVKALLLDGDTLVDVCNWADHEGHDAEPASASWHYVNVPITEAHYQPKYDPRGGGVVDKITHYRKLLADKSAPIKDRRRALLFFVHFVEDVHQPLHVGDRGDRGGNLSQVQYHGQGDNLHRLWDTSMIEATKETDKRWTDDVMALVTPASVTEWETHRRVEEWADESLRAAQEAYTEARPPHKPLGTGAEIGPDYERRSLPVVRLRLAQAGVRLADELNAIFK